jgi:predicted small lipoprotein YifL
MKWCRAELALYLIITILGIGQMITACGQKGSLYLPSEDDQVQKINNGNSV